MTACALVPRSILRPSDPDVVDMEEEDGSEEGNGDSRGVAGRTTGPGAGPSCGCCPVCGCELGAVSDTATGREAHVNACLDRAVGLSPARGDAAGAGVAMAADVGQQVFEDAAAAELARSGCFQGLGAAEQHEQQGALQELGPGLHGRGGPGAPHRSSCASSALGRLPGQLPGGCPWPEGASKEALPGLERRGDPFPQPHSNWGAGAGWPVEMVVETGEGEGACCGTQRLEGPGGTQEHGQRRRQEQQPPVSGQVPAGAAEGQSGGGEHGAGDGDDGPEEWDCCEQPERVDDKDGHGDNHQGWEGDLGMCDDYGGDRGSCLGRQQRQHGEGDWCAGGQEVVRLGEGLGGAAAAAGEQDLEQEGEQGDWGMVEWGCDDAEGEGWEALDAVNGEGQPPEVEGEGQLEVGQQEGPAEEDDGDDPVAAWWVPSWGGSGSGIRLLLYVRLLLYAGSQALVARWGSIINKATLIVARPS